MITMLKNRIWVLVLFILISNLFFFNSVKADDAFDKSCSPNQIIFSTGVKNNTYSQAMQPLIQIVPDLICERTDSSGGKQNVEFLLGLGGDAEAALVPTDVIEYMSRTNPEVKKLRSIISLWGNALHIIVSVNGYTTKRYGMINSKPIYIQELRDLRGLKVAVFGSPVVSARMIDERLKLNLTDFIEVTTVADGLKKLDEGEVQAFMTMGGYPIKYVEDLDPKKYTLANVDPASITALGAPYYATKINYPKIGANGFNAITSKNEVVVRPYKTQKWIDKYNALYKAFKDNLQDLQEMRGAHSAWKLINIDEMDSLSGFMYEYLKKDAVSNTPVQNAAITNTEPQKMKKK